MHHHPIRLDQKEGMILFTPPYGLSYTFPLSSRSHLFKQNPGGGGVMIILFSHPPFSLKNHFHHPSVSSWEGDVKDDKRFLCFPFFSIHPSTFPSYLNISWSSWIGDVKDDKTSVFCSPFVLKLGYFVGLWGKMEMQMVSTFVNRLVSSNLSSIPYGG